ncbi:MAG: YggT family protein [Dehalococcoidia bacterium]|jgi:YggT family protein
MLFVKFVQVFTDIMIAAIFIRAIMSWVTNDPRNPLISALDQITEPILGPLRRIMPRMGMFDFTPMVAIFILFAIQTIVTNAYSG